ncbi:hypothetical protein A3K87_20690 [Variovorax paradoxus]|uniref:HTH luxR-type domain-containing protein n=1 Tax=Variovorax paradoxus TaxID=34073 RepID=A0AA91DL01_VARPD|nr:LuxR C-terminal-related transcriptional regulator [Variovorax paradoxus]OAK61358.1 hypothetical protein A3K87_20690 [Variovorax paradoxus]
MLQFAATNDRAQALRSLAAAKAVGSLFSAANELSFALLMRLIEEGDAPAASRIARCILEGKGSGLGADRLSAVVIHERHLAAEAEGADRSVPARSLLSPRELGILQLMSQGLSNREIAESSYRSLHTVDAQVKKIYRKLAVKSRAQAVSDAIQKGLLN